MRVPHGNHYTIFSVFLGNLQSHAYLPRFVGMYVCSSSKMRVLLQTSSKQADNQSRPQVSREMLLIHCQAWTCPFIVTLECTSPAKRLLSKTANEKKFLSTKSLTFTLPENQWTLLKLTNRIKVKLSSTSATKTKPNKYICRLRYTWRTLLKFKNTKKLKYNVSNNKHNW